MQDLQEEQQYHLGNARRHLQTMHGTGVVRGPAASRRAATSPPRLHTRSLYRKCPDLALGATAGEGSAVVTRRGGRAIGPARSHELQLAPGKDDGRMISGIR